MKHQWMQSLKNLIKKFLHAAKVSYIAACVALIVVIIVAANIIYLSVTPQSTPNNTLDPHSTVPGTQAKTPPVTSLPKITIDMDNFFALGGWESYHAYDVSELVNSNPWSDDLNIKALPVINNRVKYYTSGLASNSDPLAMVERLRETAGLIGLDLKDEDIKYIYEPDEMDMKIEVVQRVYAETDRLKLKYQLICRHPYG